MNESSDKTKVLIVAPIVLPLSSKLKYAGTERVIYDLNEQFSSFDVDSTVAATGDSELGGHGRLIYNQKKALWPLGKVVRQIIDFSDEVASHYDFCHDYAIKSDVDVIHDNATFISSEIYDDSDMNIPVIYTIHGDVAKADTPQYKVWKKLQKRRRPVYFICISNSQKRKFQRQVGIKIFDVVHNGIAVDKYPFVGREGRQDYLLWLGRICKEKGTDLAIKLAKESGRPLIVAGEVHTTYMKYYENEIKPFITHHIKGKNFKEQERNRQAMIEALDRGERIINPGEVLYIGPVDDYQKKILYSRAHAFVALNRWEEPFGLVLPEAMATGAPVIGTKRGSIPEVVENNVTGFVLPVKWISKKKGIVDEKPLLKAALMALGRMPSIDPQNCRRRVSVHFSSRGMASRYLDVYRRVLQNESVKDNAGELGAIPRRAATLS